MHPRLVLFGLSASLLAACQPNVFRTVVKGETTVQGDALGGILSAIPAIGSFTNIDFSKNEDFKSQGVSKSQVSSTRVEGIELKILSPIDQDFTFLDNVAFFVRMGDQEQLIADKSDIASLSLRAPSPTLVLDVKNVELAPYVMAPQTSIVVRGKGHSPSVDTRLEADVVLKVEVKLLP